MAINKLGLTRDQLASFLNDFEQIKQFERLFSIVDTEVAPDAVTQATILAGNANASANEALGEIESIQSLLQLLEGAPEGPSVSDIAKLQEQITALQLAAVAGAATKDDVAGLQEQISALQQLPPPKEFRTPRYGSFHDTTDQTAAVINTAYAMTFNSTDLSQGVYIGSPTSRIYVDRPNVYNIQFSAQLFNAGGAPHRAWIWINKNGSAVANTATALRIEGNNTEAVAAWNFLLQMNAGDYFELMWEVDNTGISLQTDPATGVHPVVPSIILTVTDNVSSLEV
jgi:hypothetical protein